MHRRTFLTAAAGTTFALATGCSRADSAPLAAHVFKSPTCGCCNAWVDHLEANGFAVTVEDVNAMNAVKGRLGVPQDLWSCHTAQIGNYVVEGHVPAADIIRLIDEAATVSGLAVPGMPAGSPGMEMPGRRDAYTVWAFGPGGRTAFAQHG